MSDENASNIVKVFRTTRYQDEKPEMISAAIVSITDNLGNMSVLEEKPEGIYSTDSLKFRGVPGRYYTLSVRTTGGDEYRSDSCLMWPVQDIDSLYFAGDYEISGGETINGIRIFIDSKNDSTCLYHRWTYQEYWKIGTPDPQRYDYFGDTMIIPRSDISRFCWGKGRQDQILISPVAAGNTGSLIKKPILFVASNKSTRLSIRYFLSVKQMSISKEEYYFWNQMKQISESGGDIFDKQPFRISSNIHCVSNPDIPVIGYFHVSSVSRRSIYINVNEIEDLGLPVFKYYCNRTEIGLIDYPDTPFMKSTMTFDKIYAQFTDAGYVFVEPLYNIDRSLFRLAFTSPACADCSLQFSTSRPDFWLDGN